MFYALIALAIVTAAAVLFTFATKHFRNKDVDMSDALADQKRTEELVADACAHYPASQKFNAVNLYVDKMTRELLLLKNHFDSDPGNCTDEAMDVYRMMLRDKRLLLQERAHLAMIDAEINCDYNLLSPHHA
jgi:hypothetical protein